MSVFSVIDAMSAAVVRQKAVSRPYIDQNPTYGFLPYDGRVFLAACQGTPKVAIRALERHDSLTWLCTDCMSDLTLFQAGRGRGLKVAEVFLRHS